MERNIGVTADFSGGLDLVFYNKNQIKLQVPQKSTITNIISILQQKHANDKKEMFAMKGKIRNGILILVNDIDWELLDKQNTVLQNKDKSLLYLLSMEDDFEFEVIYYQLTFFEVIKFYLSWLVNFITLIFGTILFYKSKMPEFQSFPQAQARQFPSILTLTAVTFPGCFFIFSLFMILNKPNYQVPPKTMYDQ